MSDTPPGLFITSTGIMVEINNRKVATGKYPKCTLYDAETIAVVYKVVTSVIGEKDENFVKIIY